MFSDSRDRGAALILTIGWSAVILLIAGTVSAAVTQQIRKSDNAETSYQALSAAEAGVEDIRARLAVDSDYWRDLNPDENPALVGWVSIPGEDTSAQFTYFVDTSAAERSGRIRVTSSGRAFEGGEVRSVDVLLQKRNSTEYAYLSDSEAFPFDQPDVYDSLKGKSKGRMTKEVAQILCGTGGIGPKRYWYQWANWDGSVLNGPRTTAGLDDPKIELRGNSRNSLACLYGEVRAGDRFEGPVHTNDVWYVDPGSGTNAVCDHDPNAYPVICESESVGQVVFKGPVTSSCPDKPDSDSAGCDPDHRWLNSSLVKGSEGKPGDSTGDVGEPESLDTYKNMGWNPGFESVLEMPSDGQIKEIKSFASAEDGVQKGCVFSGPTRIRMGTTAGGAGVLYVTSPNTKDGRNPDWCGSGYYARDENDEYVSSHTTVTLSYDAMLAGGFNGVIYIDESEDLDAAPSCTAKEIDYQFNYPWVSPESDPSGLSGFPSAATARLGNLKGSDEPDGWTADPNVKCYGGHLYLEATASEGGYTGRYTIGAAGDIAFTDDVLERSVVVADRATRTSSGSRPDESLWGCPLQACEGETLEGTSDNQLGLVPAGWMYIYAPGNFSSQPSLNDFAAQDDTALRRLLPNRTLNFASLAANKCLALQDFDSSPYSNLGDVRIVGSVGQGARCHLADPQGSGYNDFFVSYDNRLKRLGAPPFMPFLSGEPWAVKSWSETEVRRDFQAKEDVPAITQSQSPKSSANYSVVPSGSSMTLLYARVVDGAGSVTSNSETGVVTFTAPDAVLTSTIEFVVAKEDGTRVGQTLTVTVG